MLYPISFSGIDESVKIEISPPIVALSFDSNSIFEISPSTIHTYPSPGPLPPPPKPQPKPRPRIPDREQLSVWVLVLVLAGSGMSSVIVGGSGIIGPGLVSGLGLS